MSDVEAVRAALARGDADVALALADSLLRADPRDARALCWRGVALVMAGRPEAALADLALAAELAPADATVHCNHAEALRRAGRLTEAIAAAERALALRPGYAAALSNLGAACFAAGRGDSAERAYETWLALEPGSAAARLGRADCLRERGELRGARRDYVDALARDPSLAVAEANLGAVELLLGETESALAHCTRALTLAPGMAVARMNLGLCLRAQENYDAAMDAFADAWECAPTALLACHIAATWQETGDLAQAALWLERAQSLDPTRPGTRCALAALRLELGDAEGAAADYLALLTERPEIFEAHEGLAQALWDEGDAEGAVASYRAAAALRPQLAALHAAIAEVLASAGDMAGAEAACRAALAINPRCAPALAALGNVLRGRLPAADRAAIEALLVEPRLAPRARTMLQGAFAHCLDGVGEHAGAAALLETANAARLARRRARGQDYDPGAHEAWVGQLCAAFSPEFFAHSAGFGSSDARPVFVVGMPRSGTTLTEQILACHASVLGVGERPYALRAFRTLAADAALDPRAALAQLTSGRAREIADVWLRQLDALVAKSGRGAAGIARIVDKMPDNYLMLGWIATLFPRARIVHLRRDPRDIALSCWMQSFGQISWADDQEHIAHRLAGHAHVMAHWRRVLPIPFLELDYEALVADQEGQSRRLVEWIGLPWDPSCLAFHRSDRLVRTASVSQVRQPIYRGSVGRWRRYEDALAPLWRALAAHEVSLPTGSSWVAPEV